MIQHDQQFDCSPRGQDGEYCQPMLGRLMPCFVFRHVDCDFAVPVHVQKFFFLLLHTFVLFLSNVLLASSRAHQIHYFFVSLNSNHTHFGYHSACVALILAAAHCWLHDQIFQSNEPLVILNVALYVFSLLLVFSSRNHQFRQFH